ncbi:mRNA splicing factor, Cwf18 [Artemisia annua]|uniref:mRNA splicing factor, Cwf18 n=1 Tax=Artemisia annua TaxID=35608 RepID=A0A2U1NJ53_ARTAN|nr:mRNA splicing factor, Cwf18 [Artemisia annua]
MGIEEEETIEQAAAARRERLRALKAAQQLLENPEDDETQANEDQNGDDENNFLPIIALDCSNLIIGKVKVFTASSVAVKYMITVLNANKSLNLCSDVNVKFRNYLPHDKQLQEGKLAPPELPKFEDPVAAEPPVEEKKECITSFSNVHQDPFLNIAPKKPNWDLRRDVQKKLDKLEKRTQKALYQLMEQQEKEKQLAEEDGKDNDSGN